MKKVRSIEEDLLRRVGDDARCEVEDDQTAFSIAAVPFGQVRQRADAVDAGEVPDVGEDGAPAQRPDMQRLGVDPRAGGIIGRADKRLVQLDHAEILPRREESRRVTIIAF
jgi:hypothetical protein